MKVQKYLSLILCGGFVLFFSLWCFFVRTPDYSDAERRALAKMPEITLESLKTGEFAKKFEEYTTDRFPLREGWRTVKAYTRQKVFLQKENNDLFVSDGHIGKLEYPINHQMLDYAADLLNRVRAEHFPDNDTFITIIPDKNKYIADLTMDYEGLQEYMYEKLSFCTPIEVDGLLSAEDYYYTDSHWKQECIVDVAEHIAKQLGTTIPSEYESTRLTEEFYGVYAGQSALFCKPDTITYLQNDTIRDFTVTGAAAVYDSKKAQGKDAYEFFLSGNQPLVSLKNPKGPAQKRLVVFRDSFACSLMPLLAQGYGEVVLVDLRYLNSAMLGQTVDFEGADVLFLYSASLLNNSTSMR